MLENKSITSGRWGFLARNVARSLVASMAQCSRKLSSAESRLPKVTDISERFHLDQCMDLIEGWKEEADTARSNAGLVVHFSRYLMVLDFENAKMLLHVKYIIEENFWVRKELTHLHKMLVLLERRFKNAEAVSNFYQNFYTMRNYNSKNVDKSLSLDVRKDGGEEEEEEDNSEPENDVPQNLSALFHLVEQYMAENKYLVATSWCQKRLADLRREFGDCSKEVGAVYNLLGRIYKHSKNFLLAKEFLEKAVVIREKTDGNDQVGISLSLLGSVLGSLGLVKDGLQACKKALVIREKIHGRTTEVAHLYLKVAEFSFVLGIWRETVLNLKICLSIFENVYDSTDLTVIRALTTLTTAYLKMNQVDQARDCLIQINLAYCRRSDPGSQGKESPMIMIEGFLKKERPGLLSVDKMIRTFGTVSSTLNPDVVEVMIQYFLATNKPEACEVLQGWLDLSEPGMRPSESRPRTKLSMISIKDDGKDKDSGTTSFKENLKNIFRPKKLPLG